MTGMLNMVIVRVTPSCTHLPQYSRKVNFPMLNSTRATYFNGCCR